MALGSLLRFKRGEIEWLNVKESKLWNLQGEDHVMSALRLSYLKFPKLRPCFAFCALFPKDEIINKKFLIDLWMANGFISSNAMLEAEDIGNEVGKWNELYWRSFFQDIEKDGIGEIENFKMHDLVHDLAQSIAEDASGCIIESSLSKRILHLSTYGEKSSELDGSIQFHGIKSLRTFLMPPYNCSPPQVLKCYSLRVLDLQQMKELPSSICRLKHLRYLNLSYGEFKTLPESICKLQNLQILKLDFCRSLKRLLYGLVHLKALQHLSLKYCNSLSSLPPHLRKLASLKTLSRYVVGKEKGFLLAEIGQMNLEGYLFLKHLERVKSVMNAKEANMLRKRVNRLQLSWEINEESQLQNNVEEILEVLQPQTQQLEFLTVVGYTGAYFPQWMSSSSLNCLTRLVLIDCKSCLHLQHLGKLPSLKILSVSNTSQVKYLYEESPNGGFVGGFTKLEFLKLEELPNLVRLSREDLDNMFMCLSRLLIFDCPTLFELPFLPSLSDLRVLGNCSQHLLSSIHKLGWLEKLCFENHKEISFFPNGMLRDLSSLKFLGIDGLSKLEQLPTEINNINDIQEIYINDCENFKSLPDELLHGFHSLKKLNITKCEKFKLSESFQYLTCLEELIIQSCPEIEGLHEALQHLTSLQTLILSGLPNLASLPDWLGNISLLHNLKICNCPKLTCLPMSIQRLTSLKSLEIHGCSELGKRCKENTGEDWHKIAHIQFIHVENRRIHLEAGGASDECCSYSFIPF